MTDQKKPTEESARERASQKEVAEVERGRRSPNAESDPADVPPQGTSRPNKPGQRG